MAAVLGGSQFKITGPTGALAGILSNYVLAFGSSALPLLSMTSAVFIGLLKWDKYMVHYWRSHPRSMSVRSPLALHLTFLLRLECVCVCVCTFVPALPSILHRTWVHSRCWCDYRTQSAEQRLRYPRCYYAGQQLAELRRDCVACRQHGCVSCYRLWCLMAIVVFPIRMPWSVLITAAGIAWVSVHNTHTHNIRKIEGIVLLSPFRS